MSVERYPNVLRSQQKFISSGRNTLPSGRDNNMVIIRQRPLMKVQEPLNSNKYEKIINQKLSEKRTEQYLQRDNRGNIRYESQIEKLSKICEQFFHQNQRLKQKIRQKNSTQVDLWVKKVSELEYELMKSHEIIHSRDKTIEQMCGQNKITEPIGHRLLTKNAQDSTKMDHLLIQLQKRENEILKFMHKQSQYIQIYVQKEQLQKQIRNLESVIQNQKRELQEYKRNINNLSMSASVNSGMMNMSRSTYFPIKIQPQQSRLYIVEQKNGQQKVEKEQRGKQQQRIQKIREYNNKLLQHLKMSSKQIDRLNKLLKNKMLELESRNKELQEKCRELLQKDKQIQILNLEVENVKESVRQLEQKSQQRTQNCRKCEFAQQNTLELMNKIRELEQIIQQRSNRLIGLQKISFQLAEQKKSLQTRLNQQVHICWELKQLIVKMEELNKQSQINFITQMNNQKANNYTQKEKNKLIQPIEEEQPNDEPQSPLREKGRLFKFPSEVQKKDQQTQIQEQITSLQMNGYREEMKASQDRIKVLNEQIAQMTKFIMKQTAEIVETKDQVRSLQNQRNNLLKQIEKQNKQKEDLSKRIISIEHQMDQMKEEYQKLLHEVQSSQSQTESIHKNIEELMKQKLNIVGIDRITVAPMKEFIQTHPNSQSMTNMRKNVIKADEYLLGCSKISDNNSQPWGKKSSQ